MVNAGIEIIKIWQSADHQIIEIILHKMLGGADCSAVQGISLPFLEYRHALVQALAANPLVLSISLAESMLAEVIPLQREYFPDERFL